MTRSKTAARLYTRRLAMLGGLAALFLLTANMAAAQKPPYYKRIKLTTGHKTILTGKVYEGYGFNYEFDAKGGQTLTVKLIGRNITFTINAYDMDPSQLTQEVTSWSGKLIRNLTDQYAIALKTERRSANYRLEVMLR